MANYAGMLRMWTIAMLALALSCPVARAQDAPAPSATPNGPVLARAIDWYHRLQTGEIDRKQLAPELNAVMTPAAVADMEARLRDLGDPVSFEQQEAIDRSGATMYVYGLKFKNGGAMQFRFTFYTGRPDGPILGLQLAPAAQ